MRCQAFEARDVYKVASENPVSASLPSSPACPTAPPTAADAGAAVAVGAHAKPHRLVAECLTEW